jgi:hypothetical protein
VDHNAVSRALLAVLLVPILILWVYHLAQRRFREEGAAKRSASMQLTLLLIAVWIVAFGLRRYHVDDVFLLPAVVAAAIILIARRRVMLPYRARCVRCRAPLPLKTILFTDANACAACEPSVLSARKPGSDTQEGDT